MDRLRQNGAPFPRVTSSSRRAWPRPRPSSRLLAEASDDGLGYMPTDYDYANLRFLEAARNKCSKPKPAGQWRAASKIEGCCWCCRMRYGENASQISDDEGSQGGGLCPSCRLAVNKDTGRLKWCMGGNDIWRTRIRFMLLIPAVILPIVIIIIALSKSTVIGKLSMRSSHAATTTAAADEPAGLTTTSANIIDDLTFTTSIRNDIELSETADRAIHPDVKTSFVPAESLILSSTLGRRKRDMSQRDAHVGGGKRRRQRAASPSSKRQSDHSGGLKSEKLQELQVNFSRPVVLTRGSRVKSSDELVAAAVAVELENDCDEDEDESLEGEEDEDEEEEEEEDEEEDNSDSESASFSSNEKSLSDEEDDERAPLQWSKPHRADDGLTLLVDENDDSSDFRAFWKGDWDEDFIRKAQAKLMLRYMDRKAEPCQDFYQYACGNWERYNPIPEDKAGFDTFEMLRESLDLVLKQLLEEPETSSGEAGAAQSSAILKAKNLFRSCMNYEILEKRRERPLLKLLDELGGWPILKGSSWQPERFDWLLLVARLRLYNNDVLISEWVGPDINNSDQYVIQFDQTTLGLPTKDYFLQSSNSIYLTAYKNYLINVATLLGASSKTALIQAEELIQFEIQLANITISPDERRNISDLYKRMTVLELHIMIPQIDWQRYLSIVLARPVSYSEPVVLFTTKYLQDLVRLLSQTAPRTVANYLFWRFVRHRVNNLDDRFQEAKQTFYYTLFGREKSPSRWKNCVAQVNSNMGMAVGSIFVRKYFDEKSKNDTLYMTHEIQRSFRELLNQSSWLDPITKQVAGEKVEAMQLRIGYPNFILQAQELDQHYKNVDIHPDKYFENTLNILRHLTRIEQDRLGGPVNKTVWNAAPAVVNAYYSRNKNQIMFPAGILQPPFYHKHFPRSLNYGGIGVVIGHEITHGFDDKGRLFDKDGNLHRWWSEEAISEFDQRASCLIDQYGKYVVKEVGMRIDGVNTQGENIADNGGIKQAFRAYEKWLSENGNAKESLPGLDVTGRQLFFLNFAQVWCGSMRPEAMKNKLKTTVHSPGRYRVIGTLSNSEDFAKVFNCPLGTPMNPEKKCLVW